ncbi:MAG TPA: Mu transposase C-terminal domain-containing protein, partial [Acidimicrobiales bacterium]|nr:Mu transposase C-terminal domain-containing protein [Acidimicrobiales bacterium]
FSEARTVTKVATVSLFGNNYEVDPALVGRKVELVFDPLWRDPRNGSYVGLRVMGLAGLENLPWTTFGPVRGA